MKQNAFIINTELAEDELIELIEWYIQTKEKISFSNNDYVEFKLRQVNTNSIAELKKIIEVKEDENRELNAIIDRLSEDNIKLTEKYDALIFIIKSLMNQICGRKGN